MANRNYNATGSPAFQSAGSSAPVKAEFAAINAGFAGVEAELDGKASLTEVTAARGSKLDLATRLGVALNADGTLKAGTTIQTPPNGDVSDKVASTQFVAQAALSSSLPGQAGNKWAFLTTDGGNATWKGGALSAFLAHTPISLVSYNTDGTLNVVAYVTGHRVVFGYTTGNLTSMAYYDTDGTTLMLTETFTYTLSNITSTAWGISL